MRRLVTDCMRTVGPPGSRDLDGQRETRTQTPRRINVLRPKHFHDSNREEVERAQQVVVIHSGALWDAGGGGQRPQQLAEVLAKHAAVGFLAFGQRGKDVHRDGKPLVGGFTQAPEWSTLTHETPIWYSSLPTGYCAEFLADLDPRWFVIYDCVDDWPHFSGAESWYEERFEKRIVARADLVLCTATHLADRIQRFHPSAPVKVLRNSTCLSPTGVLPTDAPGSVDCVFCGAMREEWLDWPLVKMLSREFTVRMIGAIPEEQAEDMPDVEWVGQVPNNTLLPWLKSARAGIIPFRDMALVWAVDPIKYYDYLAAGIPTVAAHLPELQGRVGATVVKSNGQFMRAMKRVLRHPPDRGQLVLEAVRNTAQARATELMEYLRQLGVWSP